MEEHDEGKMTEAAADALSQLSHRQGDSSTSGSVASDPLQMRAYPTLLSPVVDLTLDAASASEDTTVAAADSGEQTTGPPQQTPVHGRNIARGSIGPAKVALFRWSNNSCAYDAVLAVLVHVWGCLLKDELVPKTMRRRRTRNGGSLLDVVDDLYSQWKEERGTQPVNVKRATALRDEFR